ncbi:MAG TPA: hypothetical protein VGF99_03455 [Myxococcota bacterium]
MRFITRWSWRQLRRWGVTLDDVDVDAINAERHENERVVASMLQRERLEREREWAAQRALAESHRDDVAAAIAARGAQRFAISLVNGLRIAGPSEEQ